MLGVACQGFFRKRHSLVLERRVSLVKWRPKAAPAPDCAAVVILWVREFVAAALCGRAPSGRQVVFALEPKTKRV
jgi:hypothetical protein